MLIVSIPKSASTSLLYTLAKLHGFSGEQNHFFNLEKPKEIRHLHTYHNDIVNITGVEARRLAAPGALYKQHFPPTSENLSALSGQKVVVLLREPEAVIRAYYRALKTYAFEPSDLHSRPNELNWCRHTRETGLAEDLLNFYQGWKAAESENVLVVEFRSLIQDPTTEIHRIEAFWGLPLSPAPVNLLKIRYTRSSVHTLKRIMGKISRKARVYDGLVRFLKSVGLYWQ